MKQVEFERYIVAGVLRNEEFADKVFRVFDSKYFTDSASKILFSLAKQFFYKYNKIPTPEELKVVLFNTKKLQKYYLICESALEEIKKLHPEDVSYTFLFNQVINYLKKQRLTNLVIRIADILDRESEIDEGAIIDEIQNALKVSDEFTDAELLRYFEDVEERIKRLRESEKPFIKFNNDLDNVITLQKEQLILILAPTGVGKSIFLSNVAKESVLQKKDTIYVTLELQKDLVAKRLDSMFLGINQRDIVERGEEVIQRLNDLKAQGVGKLDIYEYPPHTFTSSMLKRILADYQLKFGKKPEVVCVDYLSLMKPTHLYKNDNLFTIYKRVSEELKQVAMEEKILLFSAVQSNREGYGVTELDLKHMADSIGIARIADVVLSLGRDGKKRFYRIKVAKNRTGQVGVTFTMLLDENTLTFKVKNDIEDVRSLNNSINEAIERMDENRDEETNEGDGIGNSIMKDFISELEEVENE